MVGANVDSVFQEIKEFLFTHPKEVVLLHFNRLYDFSNLTMYNKLAMKIYHYFGSEMASQTDPVDISLQRMWDSHKNVIVFYPDYGGKSLNNDTKNDTRTKLSSFNFAWNLDRIESPFIENYFQDPVKWMSFLKNKYAEERPNDKFYVTQGIMVPHWLEIAAGSLLSKGTLKSWISDDASRWLVDWLKTCQNGPHGINIVIADFVQSHKLTETVLSLNAANCYLGNAIVVFLSVTVSLIFNTFV